MYNFFLKKMQKISEDEKKVNLIKCPLPKIIYMTMKGLTTYPKKPEKTNNSTTYYTKKMNPEHPGLPSLKMNTKLSFSPNKTNFIQGKLVNNINAKKVSNFHNSKVNANDNNRDTKKQSMKEILNSYGLNRYYEKFIQNGINDQNFNQIGYMNKKTLSDFINILNIFPSHTIKMEQMYLHLKKLNNDNNQSQSYNNIHLNNSSKDINNNNNSNSSHINNNNSSTNNNINNSNNVNYVTLTFNRANLKNFKTRVSNSQNKYRYINPTINPKKANSNRVSSENNKSKKNNKINNNSHRPNLGSKNRSKKRLINDNIISKYNFAPHPINPGRNNLIKYLFKDLDNIGNNVSGINNITNLNIFKNNNRKNRNFNKTNNNSLTGSLKELNRDKKNNNVNIYYTKYKEKHSAPDNNNDLQEINHADLPSIKHLSNRNIKVNTQYSKSLLNSINENFNRKMNIEMKTGYNKLNKHLKPNNDNKIDNSKVINNYQVAYSIKTFFNDDFIKNINKRNNKNNTVKIPIKRKDSLKNSYNSNNNINSTHASQRNPVDIAKKNKINNNIKIKLPNVVKKIDIQQNPLLKAKTKNKNIKNIIRHEEGNKNITSSSSNIIYKQEKTEKINKTVDRNFLFKQKEKIENKNNLINQLEEKENNNIIKNEKINDEKESKLLEKANIEESKKENITNININIEEKNNIPIISKENNQKIPENTSKSNIINTSEHEFNSTQNSNIIINNINYTDKNLTSNINILNEKKNLIPKPSTEENIQNPIQENIEIKSKDPLVEKEENLEDMIYESLRLNRSFSENRPDNIYLFDVEFLCRCLGLCLSILIDTSKESPHITEINLEALSASEIKYFFFNEVYNENINFLFDVFDKEVNTDINAEQISPLDRLESFLSFNNNDHINLDISYLKHIKKEKDDPLIKAEEEKENQKSKDNNEEQKINNLNQNPNQGLGIGVREGFKLRTGAGDIERDIRFIDEFFSMNNRKKKRVKNYNFISDMSKNILCKELSYINEIDSELNGTNSNINNTNACNNSNSNNNINDKNMKEKNTSNMIDNEEIKEIKEIQNNNPEEENNKSFNKEMDELGIITESNDDKNNNIIKNMSNNSITIKADEVNDTNTKELDEINFNEDNKIISSTINDNDENNTEVKKNNGIENIPLEININSNSEEKNIKNQINNLKSNIKINPEINNIKEKLNENIEDKETKKILAPIPPNIQNTKELNRTDIKKEDDLEENNIYESDYILDIASIDELTYYLIKRAEIFDEDFNYIFMKITERRYIPTPEPQTIFDFMADIIILTKMEKEVIVLSLIYIERLIYNTGLLLTSRNWRRILLTSMIIANKIWDDNSFENSHFSQVFANLGINEINTLERIFLELINYKVYVKQSEYFKYLMMIKIIALKYNYNGREIVKANIVKNLKYQEFNETMQNRMRKKVTLNNSAQF